VGWERQTKVYWQHERSSGREWLAQYGGSSRDLDADRRQIDLPIVARPQYALPRQAPHFVDAVLTDPASHRPH
jgi:hypothetical protein